MIVNMVLKRIAYFHGHLCPENKNLDLTGGPEYELL